MLFGATLFALLLGAAVSARSGKTVSVRHGKTVPDVHMTPSRHLGLNPSWQGRGSVTQGFLCDWCVVGVEDAQAVVKDNLDRIASVLNRTAQLCQYFPLQEQCSNFLTNDIIQFLSDFIKEVPEDVCTEVGLCNENSSLPGMVMNNLNGNVARDRVIQRILKRGQILQRKMIRLLLGSDFLCTACQDAVTTARELLLDNETQHEVVELLTPLCSYLPSGYQTECTEFVQTLPALMTMLANDVLTDSTCSELGFCNQTKQPQEFDIFSHLGINRWFQNRPINRPSMPMYPGPRPRGEPQERPVRPGSYPYGFPSRHGQNMPRQNPYGFPRPGQTRPGQNPFGIPTRPGQNPYGIPNRRGQYPYQFPSQNRQQPQSPLDGWTNIFNPRPQNPKPTPQPTPKTNPDDTLGLGFNLEDILGKNTGISDRFPSLPEMPDLHPRLRVNVPGGRNHGRPDLSKYGRGQRRQRDLPVWTDIETFGPIGKEHEYLPDPIPDSGITITADGADENCEVCKLAVTAFDTWLTENAPELQKMISNAILPVCELFPSPMKEDCISDVTEFVQTAIQNIVSKLQPEPLCTWLRLCDTKEDHPVLPSVDTGMGPTTTTWPLMP